MTTTFSKTLEAINTLVARYNVISERLNETANATEYNDCCTELAAISQRIHFLSADITKIAKIHADGDYEYVEYDAEKRNNRTKNFVDEYSKISRETRIYEF